MAGREAQSVPWFAEERPQEVLAGGARLDGRSFEEFRNVCECMSRAPAPRRSPPAARPPAAAAAAATAQWRIAFSSYPPPPSPAPLLQS